MDKGAFNGLREVKYIGGGLFEKEIDDADGINNAAQGAVITERAYISTPAGNVAVIVTEDDGTTVTEKTDYMHHDHQGSLAEVTNELGAVVASYSYDAWGALRDPTDWQGDPQANQGVEELSLYHNRSYTGHEPLEEFDLVHMNGRVYDPDLGRFVSADPFVQAENNRQAYNRYTYVINNPLSYTDPSGYFFDKIADFFSEYWRPIVAVVAGVASGGVLGGFAIAGFSYGGVLAGAGLTTAQTAFVAAAVGGAVAGGINDGLRGAITGAVFGVAAWGVDTGFHSAGLASGFDSVEGGAIFSGKAVAHGIVGGTEALLYDGSFGRGFAIGTVTNAGQDAFNILTADSPAAANSSANASNKESLLWDGQVETNISKPYSDSQVFANEMLEFDYQYRYNVEPLKSPDALLPYGYEIEAQVMVSNIQSKQAGLKIHSNGPVVIDIAGSLVNTQSDVVISAAAQVRGSISVSKSISEFFTVGTNINSASVGFGSIGGRAGIGINLNYSFSYGGVSGSNASFSRIYNAADFSLYRVAGEIFGTGIAASSRVNRTVTRNSTRKNR